MILEFKKDIIKKIRRAKVVFTVAHKDLDLDAYGSLIGIAALVKQLHRECYIIIDDETSELSVAKIRHICDKNVTIIKSKDLTNYRTKKNLLIITDVNKKYLLQNPDLYSMIDEKIIIDHHDITEDTIKNSLNVIDTEASSACELVTELLISCKTRIAKDLATSLLSGIVLDTNNFVLKTRANTYYMAYCLTELGADTKEVQYVLKQDLNDYIARQKVITELKIINKHIAVTRGQENIKYKREELAKIADTLLFFNDIEASFVIGTMDDNTTGISARSLGNYDIVTLIEQFGGGGGIHEAAAKIENITPTEIEEKLINLINNKED